MTRLCTDREILRAIYDRYYHDFISFERNPKTRETKNYLPIDIPAVAQALNMEPELVFARLHYHLAPKYGQPKVPFFEKTFPNAVTGQPDLHVVNFPLLESILATLDYEERKFRLPFTIATISVVIASLALVVNVLLNWPRCASGSPSVAVAPVTIEPGVRQK